MLRGALTSVLFALGVAACSDDMKGEATVASATPFIFSRTRDTDVNARLLRRYQPIAMPADAKDPLVDLGRDLFHEERISKTGLMSCATCHDLDKFGTDGRALAENGRRNTPTVLNAALAFTQFWDGRVPTVEEQAKRPILEPTEMAMPSADAVVAKLAALPEYRAEFAAAFPDQPKPVTFANVGLALGAYERRLVTPARWDRYLAGETEALSAQEKRGLKTFLNAGCMVCHTGALIGGSSFEHLGVVEAWPNQSDLGRMAITQNPADRMVFKVPTLRNVAKTAPYFHDGSSADLPDAVRRMAKHQLGVELENDDVDAIVAWLGSLTGVAPSMEAPAIPSELRKWMKTNAGPAIVGGRFDVLESTFQKIAERAPAGSGYVNWAKISDEGLKAARRKDLEGCRASCRGCHDAYRSLYRGQTAPQDSTATAVVHSAPQ